MKRQFTKVILPTALAFSFSSMAMISNLQANEINEDLHDPLAVISDDDNKETSEEEKSEPDLANENQAVERNEYFSVKSKINTIKQDNGQNSISVTDHQKEDLIYHFNEDVKIYDIKDKNFISLDQLEEEQEIRAYYPASTAQTLSIPAQLTPEIIIVNADAEMKEKISYFNGDFLSDDGQLKLNLSEENAIIHKDGATATVEDAKDKTLLVFYKIETRSIPPQTSPELVIILGNEEQNNGMNEITTEEENVTETEMPEAETLNHENLLQSIGKEYIIERDNETYVAIAIAAESAGYDVHWEERTGTVKMIKNENEITLTIGSQNTSHGALETAPFIQNDRTFVEKSFLEYL